MSSESRTKNLGWVIAGLQSSPGRSGTGQKTDKKAEVLGRAVHQPASPICDSESHQYSEKVGKWEG